MKHLFPILLSFVLFSCGNERSLVLPEIENATITELHDVSHAYLFYDETKEDSVDLNRKNLISTTNWLINVDKRLTLAQAIPKIKQLQDKKRNAKMHKNEAAKNYYTCNDTSIKNLGFLEFTDVIYNMDSSEVRFRKISKINSHIHLMHPEIRSLDDIHFVESDSLNKFKPQSLNYIDFVNYLKSVKKINNSDSIIIHLNFLKELSFQDYITFKSKIETINVEALVIDNNEFIY